MQPDRIRHEEDFQNAIAPCLDLIIRPWFSTCNAMDARLQHNPVLGGRGTLFLCSCAFGFQTVFLKAKPLTQLLLLDGSDLW